MNAQSVKSNGKISKLFESTIPDYVDGFECDDADTMNQLWPAGSDAAREVSDFLFHFLIRRY